MLVKAQNGTQNLSVSKMNKYAESYFDLLLQLIRPIVSLHNLLCSYSDMELFRFSAMDA